MREESYTIKEKRVEFLAYCGNVPEIDRLIIS
jgi:hypothetical protein